MCWAASWAPLRPSTAHPFLVNALICHKFNFEGACTAHTRELYCGDLLCFGAGAAYDGAQHIVLQDGVAPVAVSWFLAVG